MKDRLLALQIYLAGTISGGGIALVSAEIFRDTPSTGIVGIGILAILFGAGLAVEALEEESD